MNHQPDEQLDAYLWDPTAPPDASVVEIERRLAQVRFDPAARPLGEPLRADTFAHRRPAASWAPRLAWAAAILLMVGAGLGTWRWTWPEGRAWAVRTGAGPEDRLQVDATLQTRASEAALVDIARIGTMQVRGNTTLTLLATTSNRHRLAMPAGAVHVRVWAPPFSVAFQTPAGEVSDLGCEFHLEVTATSSRVRVLSGWVQLENRYGESLVPEGASGVMFPGVRPGVPVFDDAASGFAEAVRDHERRPEDSAATERIVSVARPRDVYTLLQLVLRGSPATPALTARAAQLSPPPAGVDVARIAAGEWQLLDRWISDLPLPSPKSTWLWNWRDGLTWFGWEVR